VFSSLIPAGIPPGELRLVDTCIRVSPDLLADLTAPVPESERQRASRYIHTEDTLRHLIGRGLLRHTLAQITGQPAASFNIDVDASTGKPFVAGGPAFSIAHSGEAVVIAVAGNGRVGVDVEAIRSIPDLHNVTRSSFAPDELSALNRFPEGEPRTAAFFRGWTRKEAILKALGHGLSSLHDISVSLTEGDRNTLLRLGIPGEELRAWTVCSMVGTPLYAAAFAWDQPVLSVRRISIPIDYGHQTQSI
jgi:4'-phosphopantetheinyl transferase